MKFLASIIFTIPAATAFVASSSTSRASTTLFAISEDSFDRRAFFVSTAAASLAVAFPLFPEPALADGVDYTAVSADIADLIKKNPDVSACIFVDSIR
jgi:hypothetical protein